MTTRPLLLLIRVTLVSRDIRILPVTSVARSWNEEVLVASVCEGVVAARAAVNQSVHQTERSGGSLNKIATVHREKIGVRIIVGQQPIV